MTERLYYTDSYLTEFYARVVERSAEGTRIYLDRTAFYPTSGGQLFDNRLELPERPSWTWWTKATASLTCWPRP